MNLRTFTLWCTLRQTQKYIRQPDTSLPKIFKAANVFSTAFLTKRIEFQEDVVLS